MANRLKTLKIDYVSMCPRPMNQGAVFVLAKSQEDPAVPTPPATAATAAEPVVGISKAELDAAIAAAVAKADEARAVEKAESEAAIAKLSADLEATTTRAQAAEVVAKAEADARVLATAIAKASTEMPALPGTTPTEVGTLLAKLTPLIPAEDLTTLETILKASSVAVSTGDLFKEAGSSHPVTGAGGQSAMDKINVAAKALIEKDASLSMPTAISKAMELNPDLVLADRKERGFSR
jgi:hypothetical protein